ncbi:MAG: FkbM family methyltransferase [Parvularculaceae bacterium]
MNEPPFGSLAPTPAQAYARALAQRLPYTYVGRKLASLLLGPAGGRARRAFDVEVFGGARARLHPYDNICEKRVYLTPAHWDPDERALLADAIGRPPASKNDPFIFVDVGANVGLYALFARSVARAHRRGFRALCVEPDPDMRARLAFNIAASDAGDDVSVSEKAAAAAHGLLRFAPNPTSRGMSRVAADGARAVEGAPLTDILADARIARVDALKIDIEGGEGAVLDAFYAAAPAALRPRFVIAEISHAGDDVESALARSGYETLLRNELNVVARLTPQTD